MSFGRMGRDFGRMGSGGTAGESGPAPVPVDLDPVVGSDITGDALLAFGFDRLVDGFSSNTVRLKRLSDNAESDFGLDANGKFDTAAANTWRAGANVDCVKFYDQKGSAKELANSGTAEVVRSDVWFRFASTYSETDGQLTRSTSQGGVGVNLGAAGHMTVTGTGASLSTATLEMHLLWAPNVRKKATNDATDPIVGSTSTAEHIISYGNTANARWYWQMAGAAAAGTSRTQTASGDITNANWGMSNAGTYRWKQYAQHINSFVLTPTASQHYSGGRRTQSTNHAANIVTALAAGTMDNGVIHIGANFASTSNNSANTSNRPNVIVGALIATTGLTDLERWNLQAKLSAVGQQHRLLSVEDTMAMMDEWLLMKDVDGSGAVAGRNGLTTLQFNQGVGNTFDLAFDTTFSGLRGIRSPTADNDNHFLATNTYFAGVTTGTMLAIGFNEQANSSLQYWFVQGTDTDGTAGQDPEWSLGLGWDHNCASSPTLMATSRDTDGLMGGRCEADGTAWGAAIYEGGGAGANQSQGKYNRNGATHNTFVFGETISGVVWNAAEWLGGGSAPYLLDAPVRPPVPENLTALYRTDGPILQIATFEEPTGYSRAASYAVRKPLRLSATTKSYLSAGCLTPLGQFDGSVARNTNAGVVDSNASAKIKSHQFQQALHGTRIAFAFKAGLLSQTQIENLMVNMYKVLAS